MINISLSGEPEAHVGSRVLGGGDCPRFITLTVGPLSVTLASALQARAIADVLTDAARELEAAEALVER